VEENPDFKMTGEYYGASVINPPVWGSGKTIDLDYYNFGTFDSTIEFDFKHIGYKFVGGTVNHVEGHLDTSYGGGDISAVVSHLQKREEVLANNPLMSISTFLSSHDENGFALATGGDKGKTLAAVALQLTAVGQPVIYYGEETGQYGQVMIYNDDISHENRYDFDWGKTIDNNQDGIFDYDVPAHYQALIKIRKDYMDAFTKGMRDYSASNDSQDVLGFTAQYGNQSVAVFINSTDSEKTLSFANSPFMQGQSVKDAYATERGLTAKSYIVGANGAITSVKVPKRSEGGVVILVNSTQRVDAQQPQIITLPEGGQVAVGGEKVLTVAAESSDGGNLTYQWYKNGEPIPSATNETYYVPTNTSETARYSVKVTNTNPNATGTQTAYIITAEVEVAVTGQSLPGIGYGDFDGKDGITDSDVLWIRRYLTFKGNVPSMLAAYSEEASAEGLTSDNFNESMVDFDSSGAIDGNDILWLKRYISSGEDADAMLQKYPDAPSDFQHIK
jgi:hypothetical protein